MTLFRDQRQRRRARPSGEPGLAATIAFDWFALAASAPLCALGYWAQPAGHTLIFLGLMGLFSVLAWRKYQQRKQRQADHRARRHLNRSPARVAEHGEPG